MSILGEIQKFSQEAIIELFVLDTTIRGGDIYYFHAGTNEVKGNIVWQGQEYVAIPVEADGFEMSGSTFPRPKLRLANINGVFSAMTIQLKDFIGCKVIRKRTLGMYLDAVNFTGGNPSANPAEAFRDDIFFVVQKTSENKLYVEFELGSSLDLQGVMLPRGQIIAGCCRWKYRSQECGYTGDAVATSTDVPTNVLSQDMCSKSVNGCKLRFGEYGDLRFGGFPGAALLEV